LAGGQWREDEEYLYTFFVWFKILEGIEVANIHPLNFRSPSTLAGIWKEENMGIRQTPLTPTLGSLYFMPSPLSTAGNPLTETTTATSWHPLPLLGTQTTSTITVWRAPSITSIVTHALHHWHHVSHHYCRFTTSSTPPWSGILNHQHYVVEPGIQRYHLRPYV